MTNNQAHIKILQVCNTDFYLKKFLTPLVEALITKGYDVECLTEGSQHTDHLLAQGVTVHNFYFPSKPSPFEFIRAIHRMTKLLVSAEYHLVSSHNRNSSIVARIAAFRANVPINLYTAHGFYFQDHQSPITKKLVEIFEGILAKITTFTLSQSNEDVIHMTGKKWIDPSQILFIGNGIDADRFSPQTSSIPKTREIRICASGRLVTGKGFEDILRAIAVSTHRDNIEFLFIGGNIEQDISSSADEFSLLIERLGLQDHVTITGMIDNVEDYLNSSDLFIHPSYAEGMPRSLLEAMSTGLACIATRIRGAREIIDHEKNGLHSLGLNARQTILEQYQEEDYIDRQVQAIEELLHQKGFI